MSEQRFTIQKASGMYLHLPIFDNGVEMADGDVCILLNEQQSTINHLKQELEEYKENWDDMVKLATKTSLRNVELDEQIGRLQREKLGGNY